MAIYGLIVMVGLPLSLLLGSINPAKAAEKTKTTEVTATPTPLKKTEEKKKKMAFTSEPVGLHRGNTYVAGQSLRFQVSLSDEPVLVWAEMAALDPNFPEKIYLSAKGRSASGGQNQGQGIWLLQTPKLSADLNLGKFSIKIFAQDIAGQTIQTQVKITLQPFKAVTILSYKVLADGTATISWQAVSWADKYLLNWQIQGDDLSSKSLTTKQVSYQIIGLEPGTLYEVSIQPLRGDAVGPATKVVFQTLGNPPVKEVAGAQAQPQVKQITPTIGEGVSTSRQIAQAPTQAQTPVQEKITPSPTPSASASPEPAKTTTGGWNRLLIALSILIIAAAAAIGGYYGYEWLMVKSKDKEPPEKGPSNRW